MDDLILAAAVLAWVAGAVTLAAGIGVCFLVAAKAQEVRARTAVMLRDQGVSEELAAHQMGKMPMTQSSWEQAG